MVSLIRKLIDALADRRLVWYAADEAGTIRLRAGVAVPEEVR